MEFIQEKLFDWYEINKRDLPWRDTSNTYYIWLSEIILQQTKVDQGLNYYLKFIKNYPTIVDLANASEQEVLKDWQGLGYYSRARNLHFTAKTIVNQHNGIFPNTYIELIKLKGIGTYTAAAIASFSFQEMKAVLDGNVFRVLSRLFDLQTPIDSTLGKKEFENLANDLLPKNNSHIFNQAIMEFGALQCKPVNPDCLSCILQTKCVAFYEKTVQNRPVKEKKTKVTKRYFSYFVFIDEKHIVIQQRNDNDIWKNMFEFPKLEKLDPFTENEILNWIKNNLSIKTIKKITAKKHILSHQHIFADFYVFKSIPDNITTIFPDSKKVLWKDLDFLPFPKLIENFLNNFEFFKYFCS